MARATGITWAGAAVLQPIPVAVVASDNVSGFNALRITLPGAFRITVGVLIRLRGGQGGNPDGAFAATVQMSATWTSDAGLQNTGVLTTSAGSLQEWGLAHAIGATEEYLILAELPGGADVFTLRALAVGAGQAGSEIRASIIEQMRRA